MNKSKVKKLETRALPAHLERRNDLIEEMQKLIDTAKSLNRPLTEEEQKKFDEMEQEVSQIIEMEKERKNSQGDYDKENRALPNLVYSNEKLEKRGYSDGSKLNMDLVKFVRGMSGRGWNGANDEHMYYRSMSSATNSVIIPQVLSDKLIDLARSKSAVFGQIPTVQMENNNLTVAVQKQDVTCNFVDEGELIPASEAVFEGVDLVGKTLALFVPVSEQLLDSAENLSSQLMNSCAAAIGVALDKALLYGKGTVSSQPTEIKGLNEYTTINKITVNSLDWDIPILGIKEVKKNNIEPNNIAFNATMGADLAMLKDVNKQYINMPNVLNSYNILESNNIKDNECYVYDSNSMLLGIHKNITIEWGTSTDMFQRIQKGLRIYLRADLGVINPKGIAQVTYTPAK